MLDSRGGFPPAGADEEYSHYIEACYPLAENRRAYFQTKILASKPHIGYQLLCAMAEAEIIRSVWTTNFDSLTSRAAANFELTAVEVGMDSQHRAFRQPTKGELVSIALHGDYRYDPLKNTTAELRGCPKSKLSSKSVFERRLSFVWFESFEECVNGGQSDHGFA